MKQYGGFTIFESSFEGERIFSMTNAFSDFVAKFFPCIHT